MVRKEPSSNDTSGQLAIGALIVFIAIILVAAIAAFVFINSGQQAQERAEQTADESLAEVSNNLVVTSSFGQVSGSNTVDSVSLAVRTSSGANSVDLGEASVQVLSSNNQTTLLWDENVGSEGTYPSDDGNFTVNTIKDDDDSLPVLEERDDRAELNFNLNDNQELSEGEEATLRIVTQSGATALVVVDAPENLELNDGAVVEV